MGRQHLHARTLQWFSSGPLLKDPQPGLSGHVRHEIQERIDRYRAGRPHVQGALVAAE